MVVGIGLICTSRNSPLSRVQPVLVPPIPLVTGIEPVRKGWRPLTVQELLEFIEFARPRKEFLSSVFEVIQFVATDSGRVIDEPIARTMAALGYEVVANGEDATYIFPAKRELSGLTIRCPSMDSGLAFRIGAGLRRANLSGPQLEFPKSDQFNFVQVEIGDWTLASQWS
jgi:hypothetical protein